MCFCQQDAVPCLRQQKSEHADKAQLLLKSHVLHKLKYLLLSFLGFPKCFKDGPFFRLDIDRYSLNWSFFLPIDERLRCYSESSVLCSSPSFISKNLLMCSSRMEPRWIHSLCWLCWVWEKQCQQVLNKQTGKEQHKVAALNNTYLKYNMY